MIHFKQISAVLQPICHRGNLTGGGKGAKGLPSIRVCRVSEKGLDAIHVIYSTYFDVLWCTTF